MLQKQNKILAPGISLESQDSNMESQNQFRISSDSDYLESQKSITESWNQLRISSDSESCQLKTCKLWNPCVRLNEICLVC